jgi:hypothetical protein
MHYTINIFYNKKINSVWSFRLESIYLYTKTKEGVEPGAVPIDLG